MKPTRLFLVSLWCACLAAQSPQPVSPELKKLNIESFEKVWTTVRDKHWEKRPGGLDWQAVHDELRPKMDKAETMEQARAVMEEMLGRLKETHFGIIPAELYESVDAQGGTWVGVDVRVLEDQAVVTEVAPGTPAAQLGVRPGWRIEKIKDDSLAPVIAKVNQAYGTSTLRELILARAVLARLQGPPGSDVPVEFLDGSGKTVNVELTRVEQRGAPTKFGFLPEMHVWFESKKLDDNRVGYIRFNVFLDVPRVMGAFGDAVSKCTECSGIIIDLRGNPGGIGGMAMGMAGWFIDKPDQRLGTMYTRDATLKFVVNPRMETFHGPVAMLVDGLSASTAEIFAGGMKDLGRARIFGTRTAAAALPSILERLPNGDGFQYAVANYVSEGGKPLEGIGVIPDVEVKLTRETLLAGKDPVLEAALQWIESLRKQ